VISLNLVLAGLRLGLKNHQVGEKWVSGFVPVKKPKYIMAVRLDYPKKCYAFYKPYSKVRCKSSNSAAIVFKEAGFKKSPSG
jgi:cell division protein FtsI/penicillin-binding protein 2